MIPKEIIDSSKVEQFLGSSKGEVLPWIQQSKMVQKNRGVRKVDRSSIIASREGGSNMIQQLPLVLGAKAYCAVDLEYILKKINRKYITSQQQNQHY